MRVVKAKQILTEIQPGQFVNVPLSERPGPGEYLLLTEDDLSTGETYYIYSEDQADKDLTTDEILRKAGR